jgi:two-component system response regulator NreC
MHVRLTQPSETIRILIADHAVLRAGFRSHVQAHDGLVVVGEAGTAAEAVRACRGTRPDVLVMDVAIPGGGPKAIQALLRASPQSRVLVYTFHEEPALARAVLSAGARGYVVKKTDDRELVPAIHAVHRGRVVVGSHVPGVTPSLERPPRMVAVEPRELSIRERQVLEGVARGLTSRELAARLGISSKTVATYRGRLAQKLGFSRRSDFVDYALEADLLAPPRRPGRA